MSWLDRILSSVTGSQPARDERQTGSAERERLREIAEKLAREHDLELRSER